MRDKPGVYGPPHLSPDGTRLAMRIGDQGNRDVWVYDQRRDAMMRLTTGGGPYTDPIWSADSRYIFFGSLTDGMFWVRADGAGEPQPFARTKVFQVPSSVTRDGKRLAYTDGSQIWTMALEGTNGQLKAAKAEQFIKSQFMDAAPAFSPDGAWLAYISNAKGSNEVYVRTFPDTGGRWQISNNGGTRVVWSPNGHDLLYQSGDQIMAVGYTAKGDTFVAEKPRVWLAKIGGTQWDLAPDGKRVAVVTPLDTQESPKQDHAVVFLLNFFDELRRRVPAN
jgi:Tol biopolymer transport system component